MLRSLLVVALLCSAVRADAQSVVSGHITDASTGEGLPSATVQVEGAFRGTVTNLDGAYEITLEESDFSDAIATLVFRYIGFATQRREVRVLPRRRLDVVLQPTSLEMEEIVVTDENPAENIMRRVIEQKAIWQAGLETWQAEVFRRNAVEREDEIVALTESRTEAFWDRERGLREVVKATRQTANLELPGEAFSAANGVINLYDDEVPFAGFDLMGPTHEDALGFYRFSMAGRRVLDGEVVYDIHMEPEKSLQPGFVGTVSVLNGVYAILEANLAPNESVRFPFISNFEFHVRQQFSSFGQTVGGEAIWLPVDYRFGARLKFGLPGLNFPPGGIDVVSRFSDYEVNVPVPDSLFAEEATVVMDSVSVAQDTLGIAGAIPLTEEEEAAYASIDSTDTLEEAFKPSGALSGIIRADRDTGDDEGAGWGFSFSPQLWFNRVDGLHGGLRVGRPLGPVRLAALAGYRTEQNDVSYGFFASTGSADGVSLRAAYESETARQYSPGGTPLLNSVGVLSGEPDYFDYYHRQGAYVEASWGSWDHSLSPRLAVRGIVDRHEGLDGITSYNLVGRDIVQRDNPEIDEGDRTAVRLTASIGDRAGTEGSVTSARGLEVAAERGLGGSIGTYSRVEGTASWSQFTFLTRRLFPLALHVRVSGGISSDYLPRQLRFAAHGPTIGYSPFGGLRARSGTPTTGDRYGMVVWEHDFRSVPFELLGWDWAAEKGISFIVHGGHAWVAVRDDVTVVRSTVEHHELGASLSLGFLLPVRIDVTQRLDEPGTFVGFGIARLF